MSDTGRASATRRRDNLSTLEQPTTRRPFDERRAFHMHQPPPTAPVLLISNQIGPLRDAVHFSPLSRAFFPNHAFRFCLPVFSLLSFCLSLSVSVSLLFIAVESNVSWSRPLNFDSELTLHNLFSVTICCNANREFRGKEKREREREGRGRTMGIFPFQMFMNFKGREVWASIIFPFSRSPRSIPASIYPPIGPRYT